jgi:hypothetical protein
LSLFSDLAYDRRMATAKGKTATEVQKVTFSSNTLKFLDALCSRGTHGAKVNDVIRTLVEEGIRKAIADRILSVEDGRP